MAVIGAGPAGIAATMLLQRARLEPVLFERNEPGGLLRNAHLVENYPGFPRGITGSQLVRLFVKQMNSLRISPRIVAVTRMITSDNGRFRIVTEGGRYDSSAVIIATGTVPNMIRLPGCVPLLSRKVFFEPVEMPEKGIKSRRLLVIGGGDAAFDYALGLADRGDNVIVISRSEPRCLPLLASRARRRRIEVLIGIRPVRVVDTCGGLILRCLRGTERAEFFANAILVACGRRPNLGVLEIGLRRRIREQATVKTCVPGLFLAGDVIRGRERQAGIAVGDGLLAAMLAARELSRR